MQLLLFSNNGFYAVAQGDDHVQIVISNLSFYLTATLLANCSEIPNSCHLFKLSFFKNMLYMFVNIGFCRLKQIRHLLLGEPDRLILKTHLEAGFSLAILVKSGFRPFLHSAKPSETSRFPVTYS